MGAGMLTNVGTSNWFGKFVQWISPLRFLNELLFRRMLAGRNEFISDIILEQLGFTWGMQWCSIGLLAYMVVTLGLGWFLMSYFARGS